MWIQEDSAKEEGERERAKEWRTDREVEEEEEGKGTGEGEKSKGRRKQEGQGPREWKRGVPWRRHEVFTFQSPCSRQMSPYRATVSLCCLLSVYVRICAHICMYVERKNAKFFSVTLFVFLLLLFFCFKIFLSTFSKLSDGMHLSGLVCLWEGVCVCVYVCVQLTASLLKSVAVWGTSAFIMLKRAEQAAEWVMLVFHLFQSGTHADTTHSWLWQTTLRLFCSVQDYTEIFVMWLLPLTLKLNTYIYSGWMKIHSHTHTHMDTHKERGRERETYTPV